MSPDFKGIISLRLEDSITHLWITVYNVSIIGSLNYIYKCQLFDLSCNTHAINASCHSKLYLEPLISLMLPKKNEFNK